jgi:protein-disulfide isomerase
LASIVRPYGTRQQEFCRSTTYHSHMSNDSRIEEKKKERKRGGDGEGSELWSYVALLAVVGIIGVLAYFLFFTGSSAEVEEWETVRAAGGEDPTLVSANATDEEIDGMVEVVYVGDFACPHCASFERNSFPDLKEEYIATGDVKFTFKAVDFIGSDDSANTAQAAAAVWENDRGSYWRWHRLTFQNQGNGATWGSANSIAEYASQTDVDANVASAISSGEYTATVQRHRSEANEMGITATPSFYINGTVVEGNDYAAVQDAIEDELEG